MIPQQVLELVAEHITPDIRRYVQLATVDRTFYRVFTSDKQWRFLNPDGLSSGVFQDFMWTLHVHSEKKGVNIFRALRDPMGPHYSAARVSNYVRLTGVLAGAENNIRNEQLAWCVVNICGRALSQLHPTLRDNPRFVVAAVRADTTAVCAAGPKARGIAMLAAAVAASTVDLHHLDLSLLSSTAEFHAVLRKMSPATQVRIVGGGHCGLEQAFITDNRELVRAAILESPGSLQFASERLKANRELVLLAVEREPELICDSEFLDDFEMVLVAVRGSGLSLIRASERLRDNETVVRAAIAGSPQVLRWASPRLQRKFSWLLAARSWPLVGGLASSVYGLCPF